MMTVKHEADTARKWQSITRSVAQHWPTHLPALLFLTDPDRTPDPVAAARSLPKGAGIVYRHFGASNRAEIAARLKETAKAGGHKLLIAADPELAKAVGADGVHWPEGRLTEARKWRDQFDIQTASAHSRRAIAKAQSLGLDAVLVSTVFPSDSSSAGPAMGPAKLAKLAATTDLPLYGLGGLNPVNARRIAEFAGIAAIGGFVGSSKPATNPAPNRKPGLFRRLFGWLYPSS